MTRFLLPALAATSLFSGSLASAQIVLHEVLPDPVGVDDGAEIIELWNSSGAEVDLSRWAVYLENPGFDGHIYVFESGRKMAAGAYLRLHWLASGTGSTEEAFTESEGFWYAGGGTPIHNDAYSLSLFEDDNDRYVGPDFADGTKIRDYFQVGSDTFSRVGVASGVGLWLPNDVVADRGEGITTLYRGAGNSSGDYFGDVRGLIPGDNAVPTQPAFNYGSSCSGSGGFSPIMPTMTEIPADGSTRFQVGMIDGLGPLAFLVVGFQTDAVPFGPDCTLWTSFDFLVGPFVMAGGPGQGEGRVVIDTPNPFPFSDVEVNLTFFCQDASEGKGFTLTDAVSLRL